VVQYYTSDVVHKAIRLSAKLGGRRGPQLGPALYQRAFFVAVEWRCPEGTAPKNRRMTKEEEIVGDFDAKRAKRQRSKVSN
jgi:hypothetical protein